MWAVFFGFFHSVKVWLDMCALSLGDNGAFLFIRTTLLAVSFLFLLEFGFATFSKPANNPRKLLIYSLLVIVLFLMFKTGGNSGYLFFTQYFLGFAGVIFVAVSFLFARDAGQPWLKPLRILECIFMAAYAFSQLFVTGDLFYIHPFFTTAGFFSVFGFPVELLKCAIGLIGAFLLWVYWYALRGSLEFFTFAKKDIKKKYVVFTAVFLVGCMTLSWFIVEIVGSINIEKEMERLYARINTAAAAVNPRRVETLSGSQEDLGTPDYERLKEQLYEIKKVNNDARFVYLMRLNKAGDVIFLVDSEPSSSPSYSPPGQIYSEASKDLKKNFITDHAFFLSYTDRWGSWYSAFAPIVDLRSGRFVALMGIDIYSSLWQTGAFRQRLLGIMFVWCMFVVLIGFFVFLQLSRVVTSKIADQQRFLDILLGSIPVPVYYKNIKGRYLGCNTAFENFMGISKDELIGKTVYNIVSSQTASFYDEKDKELILNPGLQIFESVLRRSDGLNRNMLFNKATFLDDLGHVSGIIGVALDITERKESEEKLAASQKKYLDLFENANDFIFTADVDGNFTSSNRSLENSLGYTKEEFKKLNLGHVLTPESFLKAKDLMKKAISEKSDLKELQPFEMALISKGGKTLDVEINTRLLWEKGKISGIHGIIRDVTERRKIEKDLKLLATIVEISDDAIISKDLRGIITSWNKGAGKIYGYRAEEILGRSINILLPENLKEDILRILDLVQKNKNVEHYETKRKRKDGAIIDVSLTVSPIKDKDGHIIGASTIARDITESKRLQDVIFSEKERLSVTLSSIGDGVIATDIEGKITLMNRASEILTGWKEQEAYGQPSEKVFRIINEQTRQTCANPFEEVVKKGRVIELENHTVLITKNGAEKVIADSGAPIHD
ncbi:MAG TPA: PAS domain S-box protein, partial [Candidatus Omnitrophota bacterium]|nr:PAS domain S-box protein [Candidatus Omnitrophota bacterium]